MLAMSLKRRVATRAFSRSRVGKAKTAARPCTCPPHREQRPCRHKRERARPRSAAASRFWLRAIVSSGNERRGEFTLGVLAGPVAASRSATMPGARPWASQDGPSLRVPRPQRCEDCRVARSRLKTVRRATVIRDVSSAKKGPTNSPALMVDAGCRLRSSTFG